MVSRTTPGIATLFFLHALQLPAQSIGPQEVPFETLAVSASAAWQLLSAVAVAALIIGIWWVRMQRLNAHRRSMKAFHALSENVIAAGTPEEIAEKLADVLPQITETTRVHMYLYNRQAKVLERVTTSDEPEPMAIPVENPQPGFPSGAAKCFSTRSVVQIADARRNPLVSAEWQPGQVRAVMFVPMLAQQDVLGVLEAGTTLRPGYFSPEEQAAIQHLSNQAAASLKLQDQRKVREQLLRSEKLAATGQLISGVANQLREPLESISTLSADLLREHTSSAIHSELKQIAAEARRASEIVARLVSFARAEDSSVRLVDLNALIGGLVEFRGTEWQSLGLRVQNRLAPERSLVLGVQGQLEQVFLDLLVYAEQNAAISPAKTLSVSSARMGGRSLVEIGFSVLHSNDVNHANDLDVCRGLIQSHGGEIRFRTQTGAAGFEVDIPLAPGSEQGEVKTAPRTGGRPLTLMVVDSDVIAQRQLVRLLAARGHRVVPVSAEQATDSAQRLRFDAVIWAVRPGGWKWSEFHERLRSAVQAFVLVSDGYDADFAKSLKESGGYLLGRPIQESELDQVLQALELQTTVGL
jgi:K+-sensing histidine kinase KdpD